jgi:uncharacterized membrane protein
MIRGIFYFMVYGFCGWVMECCYVRAGGGVWINRGFLHGPFIPLYGAGALLTIYVLQKAGRHPVLILLMAFIFLSILEYIVGWGLEKLFRTKWWDYSKRRFNIQGRVCLRNSCYWGVLGLFLMEVAQPWLEWLVREIPPEALRLAAGIFLLYFILDSAASIRRAADFNRILQELEVFGEKIQREAEDYRLRYEEKRLAYEAERNRRREEWRQAIEAAKQEMLLNLAENSEQVKLRMEQANEDLRLALANLKEELAETANQWEEAVKVYQERLKEGAEKILSRQEYRRRRHRIWRLTKAFPSMRQSGPVKGGGELLANFQDFLRETMGKAEGERGGKGGGPRRQG